MFPAAQASPSVGWYSRGHLKSKILRKPWSLPARKRVVPYGSKDVIRASRCSPSENNASCWFGVRISLNLQIEKSSHQKQKPHDLNKSMGL